ncbi:hypothetical protein [Streptomyces sp. NPDC004267]|uniref:hypothetical protein n=1 Tax=Streptomyces sp. NPDC004267 TaxID=3364694 RepID=UPI00368E82C2
MKNDRLNHAGYLWVLASLTASMGARAHYRRRREEHSNRHAAAQRNLFNRLLEQLYHCFKNRRLFDELAAFPTSGKALGAAAAQVVDRSNRRFHPGSQKFPDREVLAPVPKDRPLDDVELPSRDQAGSETRPACIGFEGN